MPWCSTAVVRRSPRRRTVAARVSRPSSSGTPVPTCGAIDDGRRTAATAGATGPRYGRTASRGPPPARAGRGPPDSRRRHAEPAATHRPAKGRWAHRVHRSGPGADGPPPRWESEEEQPPASTCLTTPGRQDRLAGPDGVAAQGGPESGIPARRVRSSAPAAVSPRGTSSGPQARGHRRAGCPVSAVGSPGRHPSRDRRTGRPRQSPCPSGTHRSIPAHPPWSETRPVDPAGPPPGSPASPAAAAADAAGPGHLPASGRPADPRTPGLARPPSPTTSGSRP